MTIVDEPSSVADSSGSTPRQRGTRGGRGTRWLIVALVVVVAASIVMIVWLVAGDDETTTDSAATSPSAEKPVVEEQLTDSSGVEVSDQSASEDQSSALEAEAGEQPALTDEPEYIEVSFDGDECTVSGQAVHAGDEKLLTVFTTSDEYARASLYVFELLDGRSYQDLVAAQPSPGEYFMEPDFVELRGTDPAESFRRSNEMDLADNQFLTAYSLDEGEHAILVGLREFEDSLLGWQGWHGGIWLCSPLQVTQS